MTGAPGERETTLRLREAFASLGETAAPRPDCPPPDRLWATAVGESTAEERREVIAHMATCGSCAAAFRLARGLVQEEASTQAPPEPIRLVREPWVRWSVGLAAAAALVATLTPLGWWHQTPQYRGDRDGEIRSLIRDGAEGTPLPREKAELRWTAGPPGSRYEVRVLTRDGQEVAVESGLERPQYTIPPSALSRLPPGTLLYWQAKMLSPDGVSTQSKTFSIRLE